MKITTIEVGKVPDPLRDQYDPYAKMFREMFASTGEAFEYDAVRVLDGEALPDPAALVGIAITGSSAGVYEDHAWLNPLRAFIRQAYVGAHAHAWHLLWSPDHGRLR